MLLRNKCYPLCLLLAALAAAVAGCSGGLTGDEESGGKGTGVPITFAVSVDKKPDAAGRAATITGEATTANITSMGVFAYYTGAADFGNGYWPNFMNDQEISRTTTAQLWTYSPVKYWPNAAGEKISFMAYSPHSSHFTTKDRETNPTYIPGGTFDLKLVNGRPYIEYAPRLQAENQTDVLIANSMMNCTKTAGQTAFQFKHLLTKVVFKVLCTAPVNVYLIRISGIRTYGRLEYNTNGAYRWTAIGVEADKKFSSQPSGGVSVPANVPTVVSTFFMIPNVFSTQNALLDVAYVRQGESSLVTKNNITFGYIATEAGDAVEYTIVIEKNMEVEVEVISANIGSDWPATDEDGGGDGEASGI